MLKFVNIVPRCRDARGAWSGCDPGQLRVTPRRSGGLFVPTVARSDEFKIDWEGFHSLRCTYGGDVMWRRKASRLTGPELTSLDGHQHCVNVTGLHTYYSGTYRAWLRDCAAMSASARPAARRTTFVSRATRAGHGGQEKVRRAA
jgi:hypothetical protein